MQLDVNNLEFQTFNNIFLTLLNENAPWKQKYLLVNNASFITKNMPKAYFQNLDSKVISGNKEFWKSDSPHFWNKVKLIENITLVENNEIISHGAEIAKSCKNYFDKPSIGKNWNLECVWESFKENLV